MPTRGWRGPGTAPPPGRGPPGAAPPGRGPGAAPPGRGLGATFGRGPGAAPLGRGAGATLGRGAGVNSGVDGRAAGATGAAAGAAAAAGGTTRGSGSAGRDGAGRGPGRGPAGRGAADSAVDPGAEAAAGLGFDPPNDSRSRRATGASIVDEADLTNSPCSLSRPMSSLDVTPSSFANSCTRGFPATALLTKRPSVATIFGARAASVYFRCTLIAGASRCAHVCCCLFCRGVFTPSVLVGLIGLAREFPLQFGEIKPAGHLQCPAECSASFCILQALGTAVNPSTATRESARRIGDHRNSVTGSTCHEPKQIDGQHARTAPDTRPNRTRCMCGYRIAMLNHCLLYRRNAGEPKLAGCLLSAHRPTTSR